MPQLGESIAEATVLRFLVQPGEVIEADQDVMEVETNKATMNVASPCGGRLVEWLVQAEESHTVGSTLGYIETTEEQAQRVGLGMTPQSPDPALAVGVKEPGATPTRKPCYRYWPTWAGS